MEAKTTHDYLVRLLELILEERECAKALNMEGLNAAMEAKEQVMKVLAHIKSIDDVDKPLAARIRNENRRNAFLFKSTLGWIRNTMEFFGKRTAPATYSPQGGTVSSRVSGRLLSGRV